MSTTKFNFKNMTGTFQSLVPMPILIIEAAEQGIANVALTTLTYPPNNNYRLCHDIAHAEINNSSTLPDDNEIKGCFRCLLASELHVTLTQILTPEHQQLIYKFRDATTDANRQIPIPQLKQATENFFKNITQQKLDCIQQTITPQELEKIREAYTKLCLIAAERLDSLTLRFPTGIPVWTTMLKAVASLN